MKGNKPLFLALIGTLLGGTLLLSCRFPISNVPAAALGIYETMNRREDWEAYAMKGDVYAQFELANSYCCQPMEGSVDPAKAFNWYCFAARNGYGKAQMVVGRLYENAQVFAHYTIPKDLRKAYLWYGYAARRADMDAMLKIRALQNLLSSDDLKYVERYNRDSRTAPCNDYKGHDKKG